MGRDLFAGYATDKEYPHHYSTRVYDALFTPIQGGVTSFLEIGVHKGESLRAWRDFFPRAQVVGFDCSPLAEGSERIDIVVGDQNCPRDLKAVAQQYGPFDVVVDDGSHVLKHQLTSLLYLWEHVRIGGLYIIEDVANKLWVEVLGAMPGATPHFTGDLDDDFLLVMVKE